MLPALGSRHSGGSLQPEFQLEMGRWDPQASVQQLGCPPREGSQGKRFIEVKGQEAALAEAWGLAGGVGTGEGGGSLHEELGLHWQMLRL